MPYQLLVTLLAAVVTVRFLVVRDTSMIVKSAVLLLLIASLILQVYFPGSLIPLVMQGAMGIGLALYLK